VDRGPRRRRGPRQEDDLLLSAERLAAILGEEVVAARAPGGVCGLLVDDECTTAAVGVTSVDALAPVDDRTLFQVASITKTITAFTVLLLAEEGRLALDDPIARHLPEVAMVGGLPDELTVEHCLSHQVGIEGDHLFFHGSHDLGALRDAERLFAPGDRFSYSNAGFSLAGAVVERLTGTPFERVVRERVLKPLRMRASCFTADRAIFERVALPHWVLPDTDPVLLRRAGWQPGWELAPIDHAAGGLATNVLELLMWARCVLEGGAGIVSPAGVARLLEPVVEGDGGGSIALDWDTWERDGVRLHAHGGLTVGYCSILVVIPARKAAFCCMVHATNGGEVHRSVRRRVLGELLGIDDRDPAPLAEQPGDVAGYLGTYRHSNGPITVSLTDGGTPGPLLVTIEPHPPGTLAWQPPPPPPATVAFSGPDAVVIVDGPAVGAANTFGRGPDGEITWLRWNGRVAPRV
jgi:CubicO group peptidase (beta-lactamase class C family)